MKNRAIKYRAWDRIAKVMRYDAENNLMVILSNPDDFDAMQLTGFCDSEGYDIYEGDILVYEKMLKKATKKKPAMIEKHYWTVMFSEKGQWVIERGTVHSALHAYVNNHRIVGNIYETSELLRLKS